MNYPKRKQLRLKDYDYSSNGCYFITICTKDRKPMFWAVGAGSPRPRLSEVGKIVKLWILKINEKYPEINLEKFVIMPNHLHLLLMIDRAHGRGDPAPTIKSAIGWLKYHITVDINRISNTPGKQIFQRSFHDHIIRDDNDYAVRWEYIDDNINRWLDDEYYTN